MTASPLAENTFGKMRGRFDEASAHSACDEVIRRIVWGFASLSAEDKQRCMIEFAELHDRPDRTDRYRIERGNKKGAL